jgi:hypothetical protein
MLKDVDTLAKNTDTRLGPLIVSMKDTLGAARGAFVQAEKTLKMDEGVPGRDRIEP